jgi:hypothetical protein
VTPPGSRLVDFFSALKRLSELAQGPTLEAETQESDLAPESPLLALSGHTTKKKRPPFGRPIKRLSAKSVHTELAHRHHKVMRLVVSALNHDAHKAERL